MKELSIEEKAKRYDEAIEQLRTMMPNWESLSYNGKTFLQDLVHIIPEIKESGGERMIKFIKQQLFNIKKTITENYELDAKLTKAIAWLEKQGEQKPVPDWMPKFLDELRSKKNYFDWDEHRDIEGGILAIIKWMKPNYFNRKDGESESSDKVKAKFKVGDWVVYDHRTYQIVELPQGRLINASLSRNGKTEQVPLPYCEKWSIQDAKNGDVLACENGWTCIFKTLVNDETFSSYCFMDNTKWFCETGSECHTLREEFVKAYNGKIHPATKEQRDLLFQKMKEAGYEWDAEKKELKKIVDEEQIKKNLQNNSFRRMFEQKQVIDYPDSLPKDNWELTHEFVEKFGRIPKDEDELNALIQYVLKRKNHSERNEEDETYLEHVFTAVKAYYTDDKGHENPWREELLRWLKALKDRIQPQPKREWSEDVEDAITLLKDIAEEQEKDYCPYNANNLRKAAQYLETCRPQNRWRPSEEQMQALSNAGNSFRPFEEGHKVLWSLYNDLKKLREE